ncbi:MAG: chloride channel protein [Deltaproteobacteria bacterium]|nr:chloride channel protein [Deltaproteobacteria bacterium]
MFSLSQGWRETTTISEPRKSVNTTEDLWIGRRSKKILQYTGGLMMPGLGMLVGLLGGLGAVFFRYLIQFFQTLIYSSGGDLATVAQNLPWWRVLLGPAIGGVFIGPLVYFFAREAKGHGVPEVMNAVAREGGMIRKRVAIVKILASALCIGSGGSVGREGPIVQIGSAIGSSLGQILKISDDQLRVLVACGAAAGISATFNAPIAGAIFALEIILADFALPTFTPIILSSVIATVVSRAFLGNYPAFQVPPYELVSPWELVFYCVLGLLAGLVAVSFIVTLYKTEDFWDALKVPEYVKAPLGGILVGIIALRFPQIMGVGYESIEKVLLNQEIWIVLLLLIPMKILATSISIGSGGSGGIFAPSLFIGAMLGGAFGFAAHLFFPQIAAYPGAYAIVGMGAVVAGTTHAPIQALLIIFELTQNYMIIPPLMFCCVISTFIARGVKRESIYSLKLLRRGIDIKSGRDINVLKGMHVRDFMTKHPETIQENMRLRDLIQILPFSKHTSFPLVDKDGDLLGMLSLKDFREVVFEDDLMDVVIARDIATIPAVNVNTDDNLDRALTLINGYGFERLPVVSAGENSKKVVGILSQKDIISAYNKALEARGLLERMPPKPADPERTQ